MVDITMNFWSPDTCECSIFYSWDKDVASESRVHTYVAGSSSQAFADSIRRNRNQGPKVQPPIVICPAHTAIGDVPALLTALNSENTRKNISLGLATDEKADFDINAATWSFDASRNLLLTIDGQLTVKQLANLQAAVDLQFGPGKVVVSGTAASDAVITVGSDPDVFAGAQTVLNVVVNNIPNGLSGFEAAAQIAPAGAAKFLDVTFPAYASFPTHRPDPVNGPVLTQIAGVDLAKLAEGELFNFLLFQLVVESINGAPATVTVDVSMFDDDQGNDITRAMVRGGINL